MAKIKDAKGSIRSKAGLPAKAGRRRPSRLVSEIDAQGKRQWFPAAKQDTVKKKFDFGIQKSDYDFYDGTNERVAELKLNRYQLKDKQRVAKTMKAIEELALTSQEAKNDPFWMNRTVKDYRMGYISSDEILKKLPKKSA